MNVESVMRLEDKYDCKGVTETCTEFLRLSVNSDINNICKILNIAIKYKLDEVRETCIQYPAFGWLTAMQCDEMLSMHIDTLSFL